MSSAVERIVARLTVNKAAAIAVIAVLGCLVYARTLSVPFYFDDFSYIVNNPLIDSLAGIFDPARLAQADVALADVKNSIMSRPLAYLSFAVNRILFHDSLAGYHIVNIAIHTLNAVVIYALVLLTASLYRSQGGRQENEWQCPRAVQRTAFFTAALFAVHPVMTSAVTYIVQRMVALNTLFCLCSVGCYALCNLYRKRPRQLFFYLLALLSSLAAMKTRESAFMLPLLLALYDLAFFSGRGSYRFLRLLPFFCMLLLVLATAGGIETGAAAGTGTGGAPTTLEAFKFAKAHPLQYFTTRFATNTSVISVDGMTPLEYLVTQVRVIVTYHRMLLVPTGLNFVHDVRLYRWNEPPVMLGLLFHIAILAAALVLWRRSRPAGEESALLLRLAAFGVLWFYLALALESSIVPIDDLLLEYRMYMPAVGFLAAFVALIQPEAWAHRVRIPANLMLLPLIGVFAILTLHRNEQWRDPLVFWQDALAKSPNKHRIHGYIGNVYRDRGDTAKALREYKLMLASDFRYGRDHFELGKMFAENGMYQDAVEEYQIALKIRPDKLFVYDRLAEAYEHLDQAALGAAARSKTVKAISTTASGGASSDVW